MIMYRYKWMLVLFSPFKLPKLEFYLGKTKHGTPYFLPRKWVKNTHEDAVESANKAVNNPNQYIKNQPFEYWYKHALNCEKAVDKTIGFDYVPLGWKTKFNDYRFEWSPMLSFVFFGYQFCVFVTVDNPTQYWESWLYYYYDTDKTKSTKERVQQLIKEYPQTYTYYNGKTEEAIDYIPLILKKKWKKEI